MLTTPSLRCLFVFLLGAAIAGAAERPNILLLVADQMRGSALGIAGNRDVITPHLDKLGSEGAVFRRMYANVPVCCPARAILLT
ncbi:MAG TPA: sulfatase-like hydrolase/transferase, partial [Opitutaceae bacterium]